MKNKGQIKREIISIGRKLSREGFVCASAGNLSARAGKKRIFITATGAALGDLKNSDILEVCIGAKVDRGKVKKKPSSELALHSLIYEKLAANAVIHCHPPLANAYFAVFDSLKALTFETRFYLKEVPVISQKSLTVTKPREVINALKKNNLVVIKNHGVFSIAESFKQAVSLIQIMEEAIKVFAVARLFKKSGLDKLDKEIRECLLSRNF